MLLSKYKISYESKRNTRIKPNFQKKFILSDESLCKYILGPMLPVSTNERSGRETLTPSVGRPCKRTSLVPALLRAHSSQCKPLATVVTPARRYPVIFPQVCVINLCDSLLDKTMLKWSPRPHKPVVYITKRKWSLRTSFSMQPGTGSCDVWR